MLRSKLNNTIRFKVLILSVVETTKVSHFASISIDTNNMIVYSSTQFFVFCFIFIVYFFFFSQKKQQPRSFIVILFLFEAEKEIDHFSFIYDDNEQIRWRDKCTENTDGYTFK